MRWRRSSAQASLALGGDNRFVLTGQYFDIEGTSDPILYGGLASGNSPNSNGWMAELAYIPFGVSPASQRERRSRLPSVREPHRTTDAIRLRGNDRQSAACGYVKNLTAQQIFRR
jgi:hypothetical protein